MKRFFLFTIMVACYSFGQSQSSVKDYFSKIPGMITRADSAYRLINSGKESPYDAFISSLQPELNALARESGNKSYLLAQLAGTYSEKIDYFRPEQPKDGVLAQKVQETNLMVFQAFDDYSRAVGAEVDKMTLQKMTTENYNEQLSATARHFDQLVLKMKPLLLSLDNYLSTRGFNSVIDNKQSSHPHYIQFLETRAYLFDKLLKLATLAKGNVNLAAQWMKN